jgi:dodecin
MSLGRGYAVIPGVACSAMSDHTYRVIEIVGSSPDGVDAAIRNAVSRAAETMRGLDWFEMQSVRGHLQDGAIAHFQVTLKVGFRLEDPS